MHAVARPRFVAVRAAAAKGSVTPPATKALNISKRTLTDSGRAVRNVDGEIYEVIYDAATDSIKARAPPPLTTRWPPPVPLRIQPFTEHFHSALLQVICKSQRMSYQTEVGKDTRISIILDSATPIAGGPPSFQELQPVLKFDGPGPEAINGRAAMLAFLGAAVVELATGRTLLEQAGSPAGLAGAVALMAAVTAASLAPTLTGKVAPNRAFPSVKDSYTDSQMPLFWTALGETINGRVAMVGIVALVINELVRGAPLF
ncbi:High molecular mass early light-inducible protein HV58 [Chlorella vulgaris]